MSVSDQQRAWVHLPKSGPQWAPLLALLEEDGFAVRCTGTLEEARAAVRAGECELLVLAPPTRLRELATVIRMGERERVPLVFATLTAPGAHSARLRPWPCAWVGSADSVSRAVASAFATRDALAQRTPPGVVSALCELAAVARSSRPPLERVGSLLALCAEGLGAEAVSFCAQPGVEHQERLVSALARGAPANGPLARQAERTREQARALYGHGAVRGRHVERYTVPIFGGRTVLASLAVERRGAEALGRAGMALVIASADQLASVLDQARVADLLEHRERLATLGELLASVSHEMNSPLGYLRSNLGSLESVLLETRELPGETREEVKAILAECQEGNERLSEMVLSLKIGARQPKDQGAEVDLSTMAQRAAALVKTHGRALETRLVLAPGVTCQGDYGRLQQVALNLLINALHAIGRCGRITVRTGSEAGRVFLEVEDDGPGVPPAVADRIFEPFFTTKPTENGTGLGLSISRRIARDHGGDLTYRTGAGGGACFRMTLPERGLPERGLAPFSPVRGSASAESSREKGACTR